jgi:trigger factor
MQIAEKSKDGLKREYHITVPAKEIDEQINVKLAEIGEKAQMPGFRPGKAPMTLLKQKYGPSVMGDVIDLTVRTSVQKTIEDKKLRTAGQPKIEIKDFGEGKDLTFDLTLELLPEIGKIDVSKIKLDKMKVAVGDTEVNEAIKTLSERSSRSDGAAADK